MSFPFPPQQICAFITKPRMMVTHHPIANAWSMANYKWSRPTFGGQGKLIMVKANSWWSEPTLDGPGQLFMIQANSWWSKPTLDDPGQLLKVHDKSWWWMDDFTGHQLIVLVSPPLPSYCFSFVSLDFLQTCNRRVSGVSSEILFSGVSSFASSRRSFECRSSSLKRKCISLDKLKTVVSPCGHFVVHIGNWSDLVFLALEGSNVSAIYLCLERKVSN